MRRRYVALYFISTLERRAVEGDEWGHAACVRARRASVAHQRLNYFFSAQRGGGARKGGAGLR